MSPVDLIARWGNAVIAADLIVLASSFVLSRFLHMQHPRLYSKTGSVLTWAVFALLIVLLAWPHLPGQRMKRAAAIHSLEDLARIVRVNVKSARFAVFGLLGLATGGAMYLWYEVVKVAEGPMSVVIVGAAALLAIGLWVGNTIVRETDASCDRFEQQTRQI